MPKTVFSCPATIVVGKPMEGIQFIDRFSAFPPGIRGAAISSLNGATLRNVQMRRAFVDQPVEMLDSGMTPDENPEPLHIKSVKRLRKTTMASLRGEISRKDVLLMPGQPCVVSKATCLLQAWDDQLYDVVLPVVIEDDLLELLGWVEVFKPDGRADLICICPPGWEEFRGSVVVSLLRAPEESFTAAHVEIISNWSYSGS